MVWYFDLCLSYRDKPIKFRCCLRSSAYTYHIEARFESIRYRMEPDEERALRILLVKTDADESTTTGLAEAILLAMDELMNNDEGQSAG